MTPAEAKSRLAALPDAIASGVAVSLDTVALTVAAEARRGLGPISPSRPGDPPADPTGALAAAIEAGRGPGAAAQVMIASPYAVDLEYGTARMAARPFLRPAVAATNKQARQILAEAFARAVSATLNEVS